jgi:hypothetical protein
VYILKFGAHPSFCLPNDIESCRQERIIEQQATEADSERAKFASDARAALQLFCQQGLLSEKRAGNFYF